MRPFNCKTTNFSEKVIRAFTLIELLMVIAIIAILAAILFPVFGRARENARRSSCMSNLKQIGLSMIQYSQDYDERVVPREVYTSNGTWYHLLQPYTKSWQVFACPSATETEMFTYWGGKPANFSATEPPISYALNNLYGYVNDPDNIFGMINGTAAPSTTLASIVVPAETVFSGDSMCPPSKNSCQQVSGSTHFPADTPPTLGATDQGRFIARHMEGLNVAFFDGHSKWYKLDELRKTSPTTFRLRYFTPRED